MTWYWAQSLHSPWLWSLVCWHHTGTVSPGFAQSGKCQRHACLSPHIVWYNWDTVHSAMKHNSLTHLGTFSSCNMYYASCSHWMLVECRQNMQSLTRGMFPWQPIVKPSHVIKFMEAMTLTATFHFQSGDHKILSCDQVSGSHDLDCSVKSKLYLNTKSYPIYLIWSIYKLYVIVSGLV